MMKVAKGHIEPDYTYVYTCANCSGHGVHANGDTCHCCYNLDMSQLLEAFTVARGARYYALWKAILSVIGKAICDEAIQYKAQNSGKLLVINLCAMLDKFNLPENRMKPMVEWLEECRVIPTGVYERMKSRGFKVGAMMTKYREETR